VNASRRRHAHAARREIEDALELAGWPWSLRLSLWLDYLLMVEEGCL
jgi:hypothetical protein